MCIHLARILKRIRAPNAKTRAFREHESIDVQREQFNLSRVAGVSGISRYFKLKWMSWYGGFD